MIIPHPKVKIQYVCMCFKILKLSEVVSRAKAKMLSKQGEREKSD